MRTALHLLILLVLAFLVTLLQVKPVRDSQPTPTPVYFMEA